MHHNRILFVLLTMAAVAPAASADEGLAFAQDVGDMHFVLKPRAQLRVRGTLRANADGIATSVIEHRARFGSTLDAGDLISVSADLQDVRTYGGERVLPGRPGDPTLFGFSAGGLDMHQAYVALHLGDLDLRVGRQEIALDGQRLIGAVDFAMQGRSFDAVAAHWAARGHEFDAFATIVSEADTTIDPASPVADNWLTGVHGVWNIADSLHVSPLLLVEGQSVLERYRWTTGVRLNGKVSAAWYDLEAYYQGTQTPATITTALMLGARAGYRFDGFAHPHLIVFSDWLSGNDSSGSLSAFDTLYATNHKFYGFADIFLAVPKHSAGHGLIDSGATLKAWKGKWWYRADLHYFHAGDLSDSLGVEGDLVVTHKLNQYFYVRGYGFVYAPLSDALAPRVGSTVTTFMLEIQAKL